MGSERSSTVLVTGFGPFGSHKVNSSSEAVKELKKLGIGVQNVKLVVVEIPVLYDHVDKVLPSLIDQYDPVLVISVGLSSAAKILTLEQFANCVGYDREDNDGKWPVDEKCKCVEKAPSDNKFKSIIDMDKVVCSSLLKAKNIQACVSDDAGMFLCDYIYCTAMGWMSHLNKPLSNAFIHVPPLNKPFNALQLAQQIQVAIQAMLLQLKEKHMVSF